MNIIARSPDRYLHICKRLAAFALENKDEYFFITKNPMADTKFIVKFLLFDHIDFVDFKNGEIRLTNGSIIRMRWNFDNSAPLKRIQANQHSEQKGKDDL